MLTRTMFLTAAILACLPMLVLGQSKKAAAQADTSCCGQAATADLSPQQLMLETQQNLQANLMQRTAAKRLAPGDYLISESPEGYEFRALVSRQGVVDGWYIADLDGMPVALINNTGGTTPGGGANYCMIKYCRDVSNCAYLERNWPNRYQLCINAAWDSLIACFGGLNGGVIMR